MIVRQREIKITCIAYTCAPSPITCIRMSMPKNIIMSEVYIQDIQDRNKATFQSHFLYYSIFQEKRKKKYRAHFIVAME